MQNLKNIYEDIKRQVCHIKNSPVVIYTGIGTAAGMIRNDGVLEPQHYHQYPPFIQDLKNMYANLNLFIVLIDSHQENPPYMVKDKGLSSAADTSAAGTSAAGTSAAGTSAAGTSAAQNLNKSISIYIDNPINTSLTVYVLPENVGTEPYETRSWMIDITAELRDLNTFAVENANITTMYHDFTGRRNDLLAEYFDKEINPDHLDHIIYGFSMREDHGCYFDLTALEAYMPSRFDDINCRVSFFNIYKYIALNRINDIYNDSIFLYAPHMHKMINVQKEKVLTLIKQDLKNNVFSTMRILLKLNSGEEKREDHTYLYISGWLSHSNKIYIEQKLHEGAYKDIFNYLLNYLGTKMDTVVKLKQMDITGQELIRFIITNEHMYEWFNNLNYFFS